MILWPQLILSRIYYLEKTADIGIVSLLGKLKRRDASGRLIAGSATVLSGERQLLHADSARQHLAKLPSHKSLHKTHVPWLKQQPQRLLQDLPTKNKLSLLYLLTVLSCRALLFFCKSDYISYNFEFLRYNQSSYPACIMQFFFGHLQC